MAERAATAVVHTHGPLVIGYYQSTASFRGIPEHVAVMRASDQGLVALFGRTNADTEEVSLADARRFIAAEALLDSLLAVEWSGSDFNDDADEFDACPNCGAPAYDVAAKPEGFLSLPNGRHYVGCELRDSLDAALGVKSDRIERVHG